MARCNKTEYAILGYLTKDDMSGYDIKQILLKVSRFYWSESNAQLYPILKKLENEGKVTSRLDKKSGARNRRIYSITKKGLDTLREWLIKPVEIYPSRKELFLKLNLSKNVPLSVPLRHLEDYRKQLDEQLLLLDLIDEHVAHAHAGRADQPFIQLTYKHFRMINETKIKWCEEAIRTLKKMARTNTHPVKD